VTPELIGQSYARELCDLLGRRSEHLSSNAAVVAE
jgi:hypothetical protein